MSTWRPNDLRAANKRANFLARNLRTTLTVLMFSFSDYRKGGIRVAYEVARLLNAPLDVLIIRKLRVPGFEDFSIGTISIGMRNRSTRMRSKNSAFLRSTLRT